MQEYTLILLLVVSLFLHFPVQGETNLYSGFTKKRDGEIDDVITTTMSTEKPFPLVGLGVGNLQANRIENMIYEALKAEHRIRLIDTAHASRNEAEVAKGIVTGVKRFKASENIADRVQVHVVTKVWYTYLGYERTKLSVLESLKDLSEAAKDPNVDLKVHFLLHWPQCYDNIVWMNCEEEESQLPMEIKKAGYPPHLHKETAWKDSWRALEDMYDIDEYPIASIGISNFEQKDLETLVTDVARIQPHLTQINVWTLVKEPQLIKTMSRHNIHIQVYNVMNGILAKVFDTPKAHHHLLAIGNQLQSQMESSSSSVTIGQVVLKWLVQLDVSVIPRTSNLDRLNDNSAVALAAIPTLSPEQLDEVGKAVNSILDGKDIEDDIFVTIKFKAATQDMYVYWMNGEDDLRQLAFVAKGDTYTEQTHPHHKFRLYNAYDPDVYQTYGVQGKYGDEFEVAVKL